MMGRPVVDRATKDLRGTVHPGRELARSGGDDTLVEASGAGESWASERDYLAVADRYVEDVIRGRIKSCEWTKKAVQRYRRMRKKAERPKNPYVFSAEAVMDVCEFAEHCPHIEGKWASECVTLEPFQVFLFAAC